jgi:hypothetical protein
MRAKRDGVPAAAARKSAQFGAHFWVGQKSWFYFGTGFEKKTTNVWGASPNPKNKHARRPREHRRKWRANTIARTPLTTLLTLLLTRAPPTACQQHATKGGS